jgi:hypothetical protein
MKNLFKIFGVLTVMVLIGACGSGSSTTAATDEGRLITGEIETELSASVVKAAGDASCIGEVCAIIAYGSDGSQKEGEIDPSTNRWRIRVRNGNWMFGFLDGAGQKLGYLALNGITSLTVENGADVDLGKMRLRDREMVMQEDMADLGGNGIYSFYGQDADHDGIPDLFGDDEPAIDTSVFNVLFIRPYDGQPQVVPCRSVKIVFTQPLDEATVTNATIKVEKDDGTPVDGTFSVWEDAEYNEYEVIFTPAGGFEMGAVINVIVVSGASGVLSKEGEALSADIATSFVVRDFGSTSMTCHDPDGERQLIRTQERERAGSGDEL